jgi:hypothetical protein
MTVRVGNMESAGARLPTIMDGLRMAARCVPLPLLQALLIAALLYVFLDAWRRDLGVPLAFTSDTLWYLMQSKSTVDNGWWWWNPRLGMPFGLDEVAYPSNSTVDQALVWLVSRVIPNAIAAVNVTWALMVVLSGLSATWCMRALGASTISAIAGGTLFALSPYALYRNVDHFALVTYLVPFGCAAALWLAGGEPHQEWGRTRRIVIFTGFALLGFNYIYFAFFASFCIVAGALIGWLASGSRRLLASGGLCVAVIVGSTAVNLTPSLYSWHQKGRPLILRDKVPAESETFGLKIRQLVSPVFPHVFAPFHQWVEREAAARFPNDNENWNSRLGLVGTLGFLGLLVVLFVPDTTLLRAPPALRPASRLTLAALLLATVGGFGSVFNLIVSPDIRAYNRISPFIAFFAMVAVMVVIDRIFQTRRARVAAATIVLVVGLSDQGQATRRLNDRYDVIAAEISSLTTFVGTLERALPPGAMVLQLPFRAYMAESDFGLMKQYDHFKPYLVSRTLRFSYPALSNDQVRWQQAAARLDPRTLSSRVATQGFSAILIDRYGYEDAGAAISGALLRVFGDERVIARTERFLAIDISGAPDRVGTVDEAPIAEPLPITLALAPCAGQPMMTIEQIDDSRRPFDAAGVRIRPDGAFKISGWAVDHANRTAAGGADVVIDKMVFPTTYGIHRSDVADYFRRATYRDTGFNATIPANAVPAGEHWLSVRVVTSAGGCYFQSPGIRVTVE